MKIISPQAEHQAFGAQSLGSKELTAALEEEATHFSLEEAEAVTTGKPQPLT